MKQSEIAAFDNLCGEKIHRGKRGHRLKITYYKTVIGIKGAVCSCGKKFPVGRAYNGAGCSYQRLGVKEAWNKHIADV